MSDYSSASDPYFARMTKQLSAAKSDAALYKRIVNAPFTTKIDATMLDLGIVVFLLVNKKTGNIDRVALSDTNPAKGAVNISDKPFKEIKIPASYTQNIIAKAIATHKTQATSDWKYLFIPDLSPASARFNQAAAGIDCSYVYPLQARDGGALIFSFYQQMPDIGDRHKAFMTQYSKLVNSYLER